MARFRCGLALVGALALAVAACSSGSSTATGNLNLVKAGQEIHRLTERVYRKQATVGSVRCPGSVPIQENLTFICTVEINGLPLVFRVHQQDDRGNVRFEQAQAVISTKKMQTFVASAARKRKTPTRAVHCGAPKVIIRNPGATTTCDIEFADGTTGIATLRVRDAGGKVALMSIKPTSS